MAETAQLSANDLVGPGFDWSEPHWNNGARNRVLGNSHMRQGKIMDHVFGRKFNNDCSINRDVKSVGDNNIVFAGGVVRVESDRIRVTDKTDVAAAELTVRPWKM